MTPIGARLEIVLDDEFRRMANEWFHKWHHIGMGECTEIDSFDGRVNRFGGVQFWGSPRQIYWDCIQRYLRKYISNAVDQLEVDIQKYLVPVRVASLDDAQSVLVQFADKIREYAIERDRVLRGNGFEFPPREDVGKWVGARAKEIHSRIDVLRAIYCVETAMKDSFNDGKIINIDNVHIGGYGNQLNIGISQSCIDNSYKVNNDIIVEFVDFLKKNIEFLPGPAQSAVDAQIQKIEGELCSESPSQGKISGAVGALKAIAEGTSGNLAAAAILAAITALFS